MIHDHVPTLFFPTFSPFQLTRALAVLRFRFGLRSTMGWHMADDMGLIDEYTLYDAKNCMIQNIFRTYPKITSETIQSYEESLNHS